MTRKKGFFINASGICCIPCRCKRQSYHKETKTTKENNTVTTNTVIDKRNMKFGGRNVSPDETGIFRHDNRIGSVEICDTGFGTHRATPEECEQRIEENTMDIEVIKKDIERLEVEIQELRRRCYMKTSKEKMT